MSITQAAPSASKSRILLANGTPTPAPELRAMPADTIALSSILGRPLVLELSRADGPVQAGER